MKLSITILFTFFVLNFTLSQIPTDNLILYLPFEGSAEDISGNDLDGVVDGATLTEDRHDISENAYDFDGIDDVISIPEDPLMDVEFPFSISLWYYRSVPADGIQMLFKSDANDDVYSGFWINMAATGEVVAAYGDGLGFGSGHRVSKRSSDAISVGEWHHVLAVYNDLEDIDLYIDCVLDPGHYSGSASTMGYLGENTTIGRYDWRIFDGTIDDIRVYSDAITEEELPTFCEVRQNRIDETSLSSTILSIYPNPSSNLLNLDFGSSYQLMNNYSYSIVDLEGKTIYTSLIENKNVQLDLANLGVARGVYLIQIRNENIELIESTKFVYN